METNSTRSRDNIRARISQINRECEKRAHECVADMKIEGMEGCAIQSDRPN